MNDPQRETADLLDAERRAVARRDGRFFLTLALMVAAAGAAALAVGVEAQGHSTSMVSRAAALPGRATPIPTAREHFVFHTPLMGPFASGTETAYFALGCFWGAERRFWTQPGVVSTAVGYMGGYTPNPTYEEVSSGMTGHAETVRVIFDPARTSYAALVTAFFEGHDPTQGMRQGNDVGTQYRSAIFAATAQQRVLAQHAIAEYQPRLTAAGYGRITTEVVDAGPFYFAEDYHQQYLAKNPHGYCGHGGTGVSCPISPL
jgi:peptide-methionine (S)-S-oxide reductase